MNELRSQIRAQRQSDADEKERELARRREDLRRQLFTILGERVVGVLPNLRYVEHEFSFAVEFNFGRLTFRVYRNYQDGGFDIAAQGRSSRNFSTPIAFYRILGEYEEEAFEDRPERRDEDQA